MRFTPLRQRKLLHCLDVLRGRLAGPPANVNWAQVALLVIELLVLLIPVFLPLLEKASDRHAARA
jgi:hypothetical protein